MVKISGDREVIRKKFIMVLCYVFLLFLLLAAGSYAVSNTGVKFRSVCRIAAAVTALSFFLYAWYEKKVADPFLILFLAFILFQFGIPLLYAIDPGYSSGYMTVNFDDDTAKAGVIYAAVCFLFFALGGVLGDYGKRSVRLKPKCLSEAAVRCFAPLMVLASGVIAVPYAALNLYATLMYGYATEGAGTLLFTSGITNAASALFVPSVILAMVYSKDKKKQVFFAFVLALYASAYALAGMRSTGIILLFVTVFYLFVKGKRRKHKMAGSLRIFVMMAVLAAVSVFIANARTGQGMGSFSPLSIARAAVSEMGFTFTSICFTMKYIPADTPLQLGRSYLNSFIALIPQSLDFTGIVTAALHEMPEKWMGRYTHALGYSFGLGYSVIAESFFNFGYFGALAVFVQGFIMKRILSVRFSNDDKFSVYLNLIMMYALLTYPRRQFYTLLKAVEYDVVLIVILLLIFRSLMQHRAWNAKGVRKKEGRYGS